MKEGVHPHYRVVHVHCSCGNEFESRSTYRQDVLKIEVCNACHPFYTGKNRVIDTAGQVDRFMKRYGSYQRSDKAEEGEEDQG
jgi:large subunit ribosomal protein L31